MGVRSLNKQEVEKNQLIFVSKGKGLSMRTRLTCKMGIFYIYNVMQPSFS